MKEYPSNSRSCLSTSSYSDRILSSSTTTTGWLPYPSTLTTFTRRAIHAMCANWTHCCMEKSSALSPSIMPWSTFTPAAKVASKCGTCSRPLPVDPVPGRRHRQMAAVARFPLDPSCCSTRWTVYRKIATSGQSSLCQYILILPRVTSCNKCCRSGCPHYDRGRRVEHSHDLGSRISNASYERRAKHIRSRLLRSGDLRQWEAVF